MKNAIVIIIFVTIPNLLLGQYGFQEGIIMKKDGTSLKCFVEMTDSYFHRISYRLTRNSDELLMKSREIKSIQTSFNYVENIVIGKKERLMRRIANGGVKLFWYVSEYPSKVIYFGPRTTYRLRRDGSYYQDYIAPRSREYNTSSKSAIYVVVKSGNYHEVNRRNFKSKLTELLTDEPSLVEKINKGETKFESLEQVISEYNYLHPLHQQDYNQMKFGRHQDKSQRKLLMP